jgi:hypothetical protein
LKLQCSESVLTTFKGSFSCQFSLPKSTNLNWKAAHMNSVWKTCSWKVGQIDKRQRRGSKWQNLKSFTNFKFGLHSQKSQICIQSKNIFTSFIFIRFVTVLRRAMPKRPIYWILLNENSRFVLSFSYLSVMPKMIDQINFLLL